MSKILIITLISDFHGFRICVNNIVTIIINFEIIGERLHDARKHQCEKKKKSFHSCFVFRVSNIGLISCFQTHIIYYYISSRSFSCNAAL